MEIRDVWQKSLREAYNTLTQFMEDSELMAKCEQFSEHLIRTYEKGGSLFTCGNGGSHCDAMHFAEELTGRFCKDRRPLGALALGDPSHTTCVSNDYGFDYIFSRQIEGLGRKGDMLVGLSTSGNSQNVIEAVNKAKELGITTVALLGKSGGKLKELADLSIVVPANDSGRVQEMHIKLIHTVIETVERKLFPENY
tara:strand:+ start:186 stop:773 length:588 start_codon:yes stop_codon:yes gene_type:complete